MTMFLAPYTAIADVDGSPLDAGFLYLGEYGKDPASYPVDVFWDAEFTVPAAQPIRTRNGYPVRNGSPAKVYLKTAQHSIAIKNRKGAFVLVDFHNKGWDASFVVDDSGKTQQQLNDASIYSVGSVAAMLGLPEGLKKRIVQVKATGAMYQYDPAQAAINDGVYIRNGWVLIGFHDQLLTGTAGLKGDGTNEYTKLKALLDVAAVLKRPINMCGLNVETSALTLTGHVKLVGSGGIKLVAGSTVPTLINTAYNLVVDGDITFDQNMAGNAGGVIGSETHCAIKHNGDILDLRGAKFKPSTSINIVCRANKKAIFKDLEVDGGMIGIFAPTPNAKVEVIGGIYKNSTLYDNIQILNGGDVTIERVTSLNSARSGIIVNNASKRVRMIGNFATGAKVDGANQGGWGIVCSQNTQDSVVMGNICLNNQRGGATIDTYPDSGASVDNRVVVSGNILGGKFNDTYATSGLVLNNAKHANVTGNIIYSVHQGILAVDADLSTVHGNTVMDTTEFFFNAVTSHGIQLKGNTFDGCAVNGGNAAIRFVNSNAFTSKTNTVKNLTGSGIVYQVNGNTKNWLIDNDSVERNIASLGWLFNIFGVNNIGGKIRRMNIKADGVSGWQWYIYSDNLAQFSTHDNEIESAGIGYIYQGANVTAGDDTVNGSRNVWSSAPTGFKSRIGQVAAISGALKYWNGTTWA